jgi:hypothetical protein
MSVSQGLLTPFITLNGSTELYQTVSYPVGGNVTSQTTLFVAQWNSIGVSTINVVYMISGTIFPGMVISGIGIPTGAMIVGPLSTNGTGTGGTGLYTISMVTTAVFNNTIVPPSGLAGSVLSGTSSPASYPQGPGQLTGPIPGFNCINITDVRNYYNIPYPPDTPLSSPPIIAVVSFGGGIYGQPVTSGQYAGFWKCSDISGSTGNPLEILVVPINGAINAPNADDGGATLENTVSVASISAFYGTNNPSNNAPINTPPIIILFIAPSNSISEMYRTFYTVLKNPVVCNGRSYSPTIVTCSWGAPEIAWTQKMPFPPNSSIPVDNSANPAGIAEINEINNLLAEASENGINICCASGDISLQNINSSVNTYNYAQALLLQGAGGSGYPTGLIPQPQKSLFPLTDAARAFIPAPQINFPASSPYVICVGGSALYFPTISVGSYYNAAEFGWTRSSGGISSVFSIPAYQQDQPGSASTSAAQFLSNSVNTANLIFTAVGTPVPALDTISGAYTAPNTGVTLSKQSNNSVYKSVLDSFNIAEINLRNAQQSGTSDTLTNTLIQAVKDASTALATAESNNNLANSSYKAAQDFLISVQSASSLVINSALIYGAAAASTNSVNVTQQALLNANVNAQTAAYNQLVSPSTTNSIALQAANQAVQAAQVAFQSSQLASTTLPPAIIATSHLANRAISSAATAIIAPSFSSHPYLQGEPVSSPLVVKSNLAYDSAQLVSANLPYDPTATTAPPYLLSNLGLSYNFVNTDSCGNYISSIRNILSMSVTNSDNLVSQLINYPEYKDASGISIRGMIGQTASLTNSTIVSSYGQLPTSNLSPYLISANAWKSRSSPLETLPLAGIGLAGSWSLSPLSYFTTSAVNIAKSGAINISSFSSGASDDTMMGHNLPGGLASAAFSALAAVYQVTADQLEQEKNAGFPFGSVDTSGGVDGSGTYNGITPALINLRNIYANTLLTTQRTKTTNKIVHDIQEAFNVWTEANDRVVSLKTECTTLYNSVPSATITTILAMDTNLRNAKEALSKATLTLANLTNAAVISARLSHQSATSASLCMGNTIATTYDQLGNLNALPNSLWSVSQGLNNAECPLISLYNPSSLPLVVAQTLIQAAANDKFIKSSTTTFNVNTLSGVDSSGNNTTNYIGTRLVVETAQNFAAGLASQVAGIAYSDITDCMAAFTDWHSVSLIANAANAASAAIYTALVDSSNNSVTTRNTLTTAVNYINSTISLITSATIAYNQQSTASALIATNDAVSLRARLDTVKNVCIAAQSAVQLAASTYNATGASNISGSINNQGGTLFTVNLAYAKVAVDAAQASCTSAAILSRELAVLAARRANYSAISLQKLVGNGIIGEAIAGFLDSNGDIVSTTGYGKDPSGNNYPLPYTYGTGAGTANGIKPPSVTAMTVLYQGNGGLDFNSTISSLGQLQSNSNPQPSIITNIAYTNSSYTNLYSATADLVRRTQAVIDALQSDSSGNSVEYLSPNKYLRYPNVNAVNALDTNLGSIDSSGNPGIGLLAVQAAVIVAYETQQWVVSSTNASFVEFGISSTNSNQIIFTPSLHGILNKLVSDSDSCLVTVENAQGSVLYALSKRPSPVVTLHDTDAINFSIAVMSNQLAADKYKELSDSAIAHEVNAINAFHMGDIANAISPLAANATTAACQAAALAGMAYIVPPLPGPAVISALSNAGFPAGGWNAGINQANLANPNLGPYNGVLAPAPFPAPNASSSSRNPSPAAGILQFSAQQINSILSDYALFTAKAASDTAKSSTDFNNLMVAISNITPSVVDATINASITTLSSAKYANYATLLNNNGTITPDLSTQVVNLIQQNFQAILNAKISAQENLEATTSGDSQYISRLNSLYLWNLAVDAAAALVRGTVESPTNYDASGNYDPSGNYQPDGGYDPSGNRVAGGRFDMFGNPYRSSPENIIPVGLGNILIMGKTNLPNNTVGSNNAPIWNASADVVVSGRDNSVPSTPNPSLLSNLNAAVRNAYNATTGSPDASGNRTYVQFYWPIGQTSTLATNIPENTNDLGMAYTNSVRALNTTAIIGNTVNTLVSAASLRIRAAWEAAVAVASGPPPLPAIMPYNAIAALTTLPPGYRDYQAAAAYAVTFWNSAVIFVENMLAPGGIGITLSTLFQLQAIVGLNFDSIIPPDSSIVSMNTARLANVKQLAMINQWANAELADWTAYSPTNGESISSPNGALASGYGVYNDIDYLAGYGLANGTIPISGGSYSAPTDWSAYFWTKAISNEGTVAYQTAYNAWKSVQSTLSIFKINPSLLNSNAQTANTAKARSLYSIKVALKSAANASAAGELATNTAAALAAATNTYEDIASASKMEAAYQSTSNLNMFRCMPDIALHANADDLPVIFRLNGGTVYVGGTSVAASMFSGFLGVVQSHNPINYFVNPILYDNYTFPSPLFNDISGSKQVWYPGAVGGSTVPPRIANIVAGSENPSSGIGSGIYNLNVGLGSIKGLNLAALMDVPHLVTAIYPNNTNSAAVTVYPGTSATITVYVEPITAYNPNVIWSCSSFNATVSQTIKGDLSNNGMNDTYPYTEYNPLLHDASGNPLLPTRSIGGEPFGSVGNIKLGTNPWHLDSSGNPYPCLIFTATVTGITPLLSSSSLPVITVSSTDGSNINGNYSVIVLPPIQVRGVSISSINEKEHPANTVLFLGKSLQLIANITPFTATNKKVFWWSSNTTIVNIDSNGLLTALSPGQVTIKATSFNNNISSSITVNVPTPITAINVLPSIITLNPNMNIFPLKNNGIIKADIQPPNADYKHVKWEIVSTTQLQPAPSGITSVINIPTDGTILARNSKGDIIDNTQLVVSAISNGTAIVKVSTVTDIHAIYGTYSALFTVNVVTPVIDIVMTEQNIIINLNPESVTNPSFPESYKVTATIKPAYPSNMNVFWSSSNPKVAVISNNSPPFLNTTMSDPNFGLWQITETVTPLSNGTTVITVTTADGQKSATTTVVVTTPVSGVSVSSLPVILNPTRTYTVQATVLPLTATNKAVVWESTNTSIATVNNSGVITGIVSGSCGVSVTTLDGDFSAIVEVTVVTPLVGIQLLVNSPQPIHPGDFVQILVVMIPTTASNQLFTWTITDGYSSPIFTQGPPQNGNIVFLEAVSVGVSVFTVTTADGNKQSSINLQVVP